MGEGVSLLSVRVALFVKAALDIAAAIMLLARIELATFSA